MSLQIASIASGSNGNCYYVGNQNEAVLIDVGIYCREVEKRMKRLELPMQRVKAIFISHEHSDHIRGVSLLARRYNLPVYITPGTAHGGRLNLAHHYTVPFDESTAIQVGQLTITAFKKYHDAWDPHSFVVSQDGINIGVFTDLGQVCEKLIHHFSQCHAAFLESNYDDDMLTMGRYPYHLKTRIRSGKGHLSNIQALELFQKHKPIYMSHLLLSHVSKENNATEIVEALFRQHACGVETAVMSRFNESQLYYITGQKNMPSVYEGILMRQSSDQLSLFQ